MIKMQKIYSYQEANTYQELYGFQCLESADRTREKQITSGQFEISNKLMMSGIMKKGNLLLSYKTPMLCKGDPKKEYCYPDPLL